MLSETRQIEPIELLASTGKLRVQVALVEGRGHMLALSFTDEPGVFILLNGPDIEALDEALRRLRESGRLSRAVPDEANARQAQA